MNYRTLGKTGMQVSEIGVGAWQLGGPLTLDGKADGDPELGRDFRIQLIRQCGDLGINLLDEPTTSVIIPGGKSLEDYRQAIRATELPPLTISEKARIEELKRGLLRESDK